MITLSAHADYGHSGQYIARITGRHSKFTFEREFIGRKGGKRNESTYADVDEPGLYVAMDVTRKGKSERFRVLITIDGELRAVRATKEEAMKIAKLLDARASIEAIVRVTDLAQDQFEILSPAQQAKAAAAQTLESAIETCWTALQALPEGEAKKVLKALKERVSPPKQSPDAGANTEGLQSSDGEEGQS